MAKYLEWYLVQLEKKLDGKLSAEATFELLNQTEDHLSMIKQELMIAGMDELTSERAAIQRFGDLEVFAGKLPEKPVVRANWAAPALILISGTAMVGSSMVIGSNDSMIIAASMGIACMVVSALLCCRRGKLPSLAFGILLAACFTSLAVIASFEFYGPKLDLVKRTDRAKFAAEVKSQRLRSYDAFAIERAGLAWAHSREGTPVPRALRTATGIVAPVIGPYGQVQYRGEPYTWWRRDELCHLFGLGGRRYYDLSGALLLTSTTSHVSDARSRWTDFNAVSYAIVDPEYATEQFDAGQAALSAAKDWDSDNLFAGIGFGAGLSTLWMLFATLFNWLANFEWSGRTRRQVVQVRTREIA